jgi:hypothetical protein
LVEITAVAGPLDGRRLGWIADLYGAVDGKYRDRVQLEHLFLRSPAGPGLHAFALDGSRAVGHCAVVPMTARRDGVPLLVGKVEALVVEAGYRGRRTGSAPLAVTLRERLYALADEQGVEILHAYVRPAVGRILDLAPVRIAPPSLVCVLRPGGVAGKARVPALALGAVQLGLRAGARPFALGAHVEVRRPYAADVDLVRAPPAASGTWTVRAEDVWEWSRQAPALRVLQTSGGERSLVQLPGAPGDLLRIVAWRSERPATRSALRLVLAAARLARDHRAARIAYQPWPPDRCGSVLARACRLLGFVERDDLATLYVRGRDPGIAPAVTTTPLLALGF